MSYRMEPSKKCGNHVRLGQSVDHPAPADNKRIPARQYATDPCNNHQIAGPIAGQEHPAPPNHRTKGERQYIPAGQYLVKFLIGEDRSPDS